MSDQIATKKPSPVDWKILIPSAIVVFFCSTLLVSFPDQASKTLATLKGYMTNRFGWLYMGFGSFSSYF